MTVSKEQLIDALYNEYVFLCHDDFDPDEDLTLEQYHQSLLTMSIEKLVEETTTDNLTQYIKTWTNS